MSAEQVLVFPSELIVGFEKDAPKGILTDKDKIVGYLKRITAGVEYMDRATAETDQCFKQLIPYAVLMQGKMAFRYQRTKKGGESRLHDNWSVGIGGHINPVDGVATGRRTYWQGFYRELKEEVGDGLNWETQHTPIMALLYDPSNAVGLVHFGVVHTIQIPHHTPLTFKDGALSNGEFRHVIDLKQSQDNFENWSKLVVDHVL